jgi:hypothetical protein
LVAYVHMYMRLAAQRLTNKLAQIVFFRAICRVNTTLVHLIQSAVCRSIHTY